MTALYLPEEVPCSLIKLHIFSLASMLRRGLLKLKFQGFRPGYLDGGCGLEATGIGVE